MKFIIFVPLFTVMTMAAVFKSGNNDDKYCVELQTIYSGAWELGEAAAAPCIQKLGQKNCLLFNAMFVSAFRSEISAISSTLGCRDASTDIPLACGKINSIGDTSTSNLADIFFGLKKSPMLSAAEIVIPNLATLANEAIDGLRIQFCS